MIYSLDKSSMEILKHLMYSSGWIKAAQLAEECSMSKRSVYYGIGKINDWLKAHGIDPLHQDRSRGIRISPQQTEQVSELLGEKKRDDFLSPDERQKALICLLVISRSRALYIDDFSTLTGVSRNTVINDLKEAGHFLEFYNLKLKYDMKNGYQIQGNPIRRRAIFFLLYPSVHEVLLKLNHSPAWKKEQENYLKKLKEIERDLDTEYVPGTLSAISVFMTGLVPEREPISFADMDTDEIIQSREFLLVQNAFPELAREEQIYIALHLLGSRLQSIPVNVAKEESEARELAEDLVDEFERISLISFEQKEELVQAIAAHLQTSLYRFRYGIQLGNPMLESIKMEYRELFELTRKACYLLEKRLNFTISEAETAYLTLHFGAYINTVSKNRKPFRVLIICPNGIGTGNMLKNEINQLIPQATDVQNIPLSQYSPQCTADLVVTTVVLPKESRQVVVHPILTDQDRVTILRKCMHSDPGIRMEIDEICQIAGKYMSSSSLSSFRQELQNYLSQKKISTVPARVYGRNLGSFLEGDHIQICTDQLGWEDALRYACIPLLNSGAVEPSYVDGIIADQRDKGLYMFLADRLVLAHTATEKGVNHVDVCLTTFMYPVKFPNGNMAKIIISLAAEDQTKHVSVLRDILNIFSKNKSIEQIAEMKTPEEIEAYIKKRCGKDQ